MKTSLLNTTVEDLICDAISSDLPLSVILRVSLIAHVQSFSCGIKAISPANQLSYWNILLKSALTHCTMRLFIYNPLLGS